MLVSLSIFVCLGGRWGSCIPMCATALQLLALVGCWWPVCQVIPAASEDQLILIDMISAVKLLSVDSLMQTVRQIIKQPPQQNAILSASKVSQ